MANPDESNEIAARGALLDFYSDRCVAFGGFFIAVFFGLLTVLTLAQSINCTNPYVWFAAIVLSLVVYGIFGYLGFNILKGFGHYAKIADAIEGGQTIVGDMRYYAKLERMEIESSDGKKRSPNVAQLIHNETSDRKQSIFKKIMNDPKKLGRYYLLLLILLALVAYVPLFCKFFGL